MNRFHPKLDKSRALTHVVSYHGVVPLERGLCYVLYLIAKHWPEFERNPDWILSASRDEEDIVAHNREFGTNLHSQPWLIMMHQRDPAHYAPANSVGTTSHCLRSDGKRAYKTPSGAYAGPTRKIAWYQRGIDWYDNDKAKRACQIANRYGVEMIRPYSSGSELHHTILAKSPTHALASRGVIHKRS